MAYRKTRWGLACLLFMTWLPSLAAAQGCGLDYSSLRNHYGGIYDAPSTNGRWSFLGIKNNGQIRDWGWFGSSSWVRRPPTNKRITTALSNYYPNYIALSDNQELYVFGKQGGDYGLQNLPPMGRKRYQALFSNYFSFAVLDEQGRVYSWGNDVVGLLSSTKAGYINIYTTHQGFAALHQNGHIISWDSSSSSPRLMFSGKKGFTQISSSHSAFAAIDSQGKIYTWGDSDYNAPPSGTGYVALRASGGAFTAIHQNGSIKSWGQTSYWPPNATSYRPPPKGNYALIQSTGDPYDNPDHSAFAALDKQGRVFSWGNPNYGGRGAPSGSANKNFVSLSNNAFAFAALRKDGSIVSWGEPSYGGSGAPNGKGYIKIFSTAYAFAALHRDGYVRAWGYSGYGGNNSAISGVRNIRWVTSHSWGFTAIRQDGSTYVWGNYQYEAPSSSEKNFYSIYGSHPDIDRDRCLPKIRFGELRGQWHLDGPDWSGDKPIKDQTKYKHHGSLVGNVRLGTQSPARTGSPGTCGYAEFDGNGDIIDLGNPGALNFSGEITLAAWVRVDAKGNANNPLRHIFSHVAANRASPSTALSIENKSYQALGSSSDGLSRVISSMPNVDMGKGQWVHLAAVYSGTAWQLYRNGNLQSETPGDHGAQSNSVSWALGGTGDGQANFFKGAIDEAHIYNLALGADKIRALYEAVHDCPEYPSKTIVKIQHDQKGVFFCPETFELVAYLEDGSIDQNFEGKVQVRFDDSLGTWEKTSGKGDVQIDQERFTYRFKESDKGKATFRWWYRGLKTELDLSLSALGETADVEPALPMAYADLGFHWQTSSVNPVYKAGEEMPLQLQAINSNRTHNRCEIAKQYQPSGDLTFDVAYQANGMKHKALKLKHPIDSETVSTKSTLQKPVSFQEGKADFLVIYDDVGQMQLQVKDPQRPGMSTSFRFTSRPHHLTLALSNPSPVSGTGFAKAGAAVTATLRGYTKSGALLPSFGREKTSPSRATVSARLVTPGTADGAVIGSLEGTLLAHTGKGTLQTTHLRYHEVGSIELFVSSLQGPGQSALWLADYQQDNRSRLTIQSGRFVPHALKAAPFARGKLKSACGDFQYVGQALAWEIPPTLAVTAHNTSGQTLKNYALAHTPLSPSSFDFEDITRDLHNNLELKHNEPSVNSATRVGDALHFDIEVDYDYLRTLSTERAPFDTHLALKLKSLSDVDGAAIPQALVLTPENQVELRFGRIRLNSGLSPWAHPQPLEARVEYFNGQQFQISNTGTCAYIEHLKSEDKDNPNEGDFSALWRSQLDKSSKKERFFKKNTATLSYRPSPFTAQEHPVQIQVTAQVPDFLTYPWHGNNDLGFTNPQAILGFGIYRGVGDAKNGGVVISLEKF